MADPHAFREALSRLAGGVAIAACMDDGTPKGLLVSSLASLSINPPRMLFCVRKAAASHGPLARSSRCALSVLSDRDTDEAEQFSDSARAGERFSGAAWRIRDDAPPLHGAALIGLTGVISQTIDAGTHSVFILDVETVQTAGAGPLLYFDRAFRPLGVLSVAGGKPG